MRSLKLRFVRSVLFMLTVIGLSWLTWSQFIQPLHERNRELVMHRLASLPQAFLLLETEMMLTDIHHDSGNVWLGPRFGWASILIRVHWGLDLSRLQPDDIQVLGHRVNVKLPMLSVFDATADL